MPMMIAITQKLSILMDDYLINPKTYYENYNLKPVFDFNVRTVRALGQIFIIDVFFFPLLVMWTQFI